MGWGVVVGGQGWYTGVANQISVLPSAPLVFPVELLLREDAVFYRHPPWTRPMLRDVPYRF